MNTKQDTDFNQVLQQFGTVIFCIDKNGEILGVKGYPLVLEPFYKEEESNLFNFFPKEQTDLLKDHLSNLSPINFKNTFCLTVIHESEELRYRISISLKDEVDREYFVCCTKRSTEKLSFNEEDDLLSYKQTIRKIETSETDYTSYYENDPVMHISTNPSTNCIVECNKLVISKLELKDKKDLIGKHVNFLFKEEDLDFIGELCTKFKKNGILKGEEVEIKSANGKIIPSLLYATVQKDKCGSTLISRYTLVDISEQKKIHQLLLEKRAYLQLLNNQLEQFVYTCSHDLQEPLATIKFAGDVITKVYGSVLDHKGKSYLRYIDEAVDRLTEQIKTLLSHSKIGEDSEKESVDLVQVIKNAVKDLGKRVDESEAEISIPQSLPKINGYKTELRLLFQNLISNGIKYKKPDGIPQIIIQAYDFDDKIEFLISDNGIGISPNETQEVFKIFNKVNQSNPNKGTAIGLAHCKKIVQMHAGEIYVKSALNSGSTFVFTLKK